MTGAIGPSTATEAHLPPSRSAPPSTGTSKYGKETNALMEDQNHLGCGGCAFEPSISPSASRNPFAHPHPAVPMHRFI
jgi:hypothetical protein